MNDGQTTTVVDEYDHDRVLIREHVEDDADKFHYEGPMGRIKTFRSLGKARLYADVQDVVGGFREEKTAERGVPPAVAYAGENVVIAYLVSNPTMGITWVSRAFDQDEETVRAAVDLVRDRAAETRDGETAHGGEGA